MDGWVYRKVLGGFGIGWMDGMGWDGIGTWHDMDGWVVGGDTCSIFFLKLRALLCRGDEWDIFYWWGRGV